jgi:5'-3' exoribonuclease 1
MGIPSYFSYIIKNYPNIIKKYSKNKLNINNLYLDCNSIIYDAFYKLTNCTNTTNTTNTSNINETIIQSVIAKIEEYINIVSPSNTVIIAFDGVAPVAKLEQQRNRRYKSWYQNKTVNSILNKKTIQWNTSSITPGTKFMEQLNNSVTAHFSSDKIIVSGSNIAGEGEHKLFQYIRDNPEKHTSQHTFIYGLDSDLIMLSINNLNVCPNIYLFRETPHFIQSIDSSLEPDTNYYLDIPELTNAIVSYMNNDRQLTSKQQQHKVFDYIFLCFFLGNDFLPHFPALNIRTGGIDKLLNAYKSTIGTANEHLTNGKTIYWGNVRKVIQQLAKQEEKFLIKEHCLRNNKEKNTLPNNTPDEKCKVFESTPMYNREAEQFINPLKPYWQMRYYNGLFGIKSDTNNEQKRYICINYLEGLEWTMKYYTSNCPNWRWCYKYNYPPLLQDLIQYIPLFETSFMPNKLTTPVPELVQLCYVLPHSSLELLPNKLRVELLRHHSNWYRDDYEFIWAYCRYFWESHVVMEEIDISILEKKVAIYLCS